MELPGAGHGKPLHRLHQITIPGQRKEEANISSQQSVMDIDIQIANLIKELEIRELKLLRLKQIRRREQERTHRQ